MVIADGRLYWIADAYTTTDRYPYSQPARRHQLHPQLGQGRDRRLQRLHDFYVFDPTDPMIRTYEKIFPGMFTPSASMPQACAPTSATRRTSSTCRRRCSPPTTSPTPTCSTTRATSGQIPTGISLIGATGQMNPYYMIMRLPGQTREEFVLIVPFMPNGRTNMIAWLARAVGRAQLRQGGQLRLPLAASRVYGPAQVEAAVNQDPTDLAQRTLWGQQGSRVIFGNLLVDADRGLAALRAAALPGVADDPAAADPARHRLLPGEHLGGRLADRRPADGGDAADPGRGAHANLRSGAAGRGERRAP